MIWWKNFCNCNDLMLSFFPTPYPDELLYSIITRHHIRSGNKSFRQTLLELLEYSSQQFCNLDLPNNLLHLVKHLPLGSVYSVESFINEHTLYPFYKNFLTSSELWLLEDRMRKKLNGSIFSLAKIPSSSEHGSQQFLKFCPACLEQDIETYGEAYWHRTHQVPGMFVCLKHPIALCNSLVATTTANNHYSASLRTCPYEASIPTYAPHVLQNLFQLAKNIELLMNSSVDFKGLKWLHQQYQYYLVKHDFIKVHARAEVKFNQQKFLDALLNCYDQSFWEIVKPEVTRKLSYYLQYCLLGCDINPTIDRVTHIILIRFLAGSLEEFFSDK
jgi:hypothetical protein